MKGVVIPLESNKDSERIRQWLASKRDYALFTDIHGDRFILCHGAEDGTVQYKGALVERRSLLTKLAAAMQQVNTDSVGLVCCYCGNGDQEVVAGNNSLYAVIPATTEVHIDLIVEGDRVYLALSW